MTVKTAALLNILYNHRSLKFQIRRLRSPLAHVEHTRAVLINHRRKLALGWKSGIDIDNPYFNITPFLI